MLEGFSQADLSNVFCKLHHVVDRNWLEHFLVESGVVKKLDNFAPDEAKLMLKKVVEPLILSSIHDDIDNAVFLVLDLFNALDKLDQVWAKKMRQSCICAVDNLLELVQTDGECAVSILSHLLNLETSGTWRIEFKMRWVDRPDCEDFWVCFTEILQVVAQSLRGFEVERTILVRARLHLSTHASLHVSIPLEHISRQVAAAAHVNAVIRCMSLQMVVHVELVEEFLVADIAAEVLDAKVDHLVAVQLVLSNKSFAANITHKLLVVDVDQHVSFQNSLASESCSTSCAQKFSAVDVSNHMAPQLPLLVE